LRMWIDGRPKGLLQQNINTNTQVHTHTHVHKHTRVSTFVVIAPIVVVAPLLSLLLLLSIVESWIHVSGSNRFSDASPHPSLSVANLSGERRPLLTEIDAAKLKPRHMCCKPFGPKILDHHHVRRLQTFRGNVAPTYR
jgi:hypothetical protein